MFGLKRICNTVIMDGSDKKTCGKIIGMIGVLAYPKGNGYFSVRPLDAQYPNKLVVQYEATSKAFRSIEAYLEENYPGLCVHNVAV